MPAAGAHFRQVFTEAGDAKRLSCAAPRNSLLNAKSFRNPPMDRDSSPERNAVDDCIETLCQQGCRSVLGKIAVLERGEGIPETADLGEWERVAVLEELKAVMAVYGNVCKT